MITRQEAIILIKRYLKDRELIMHSFAVEAILKEIAKRLQKDELLWGLTGLLHNIDYEYTRSELERRGVLASELLDGLLPQNAINAIMSINYTHTSVIPSTALDKALISSDSVKDLIFMVTRSIPSKDLNDVDFMLLLDKFNDSNFALKVNRNKIRFCVDYGLDLENFLLLSLNILKQLSDKLYI